MDMDSASWLALAVALTLVLGAWTVFRWRRHGAAIGLRWLSLTLLPMAAYLTRTLKMFGEIGSAISRWATNLVFNPFVWSGVVLAGLAVVLYVISGQMIKRGVGSAPASPANPGGLVSGGGRPRVEAAPRTSDPVVEDDIEAILRKHGIS